MFPSKFPSPVKICNSLIFREHDWPRLSRNDLNLLSYPMTWRYFAKGKGRKPQAPGSTIDFLDSLPSHHHHHVFCGSSGPVGSCLGHTVYFSGVDGIISSTRMGCARGRPGVFAFHRHRNVLFAPTACCAFLESAHQPGFGIVGYVDHWHALVSSQCASRATRRSTRSNPITGRFAPNLRGMQKNP